jgi:hypothetical protein
MCQAGASWVQKNILRRYPSADIRVLVVWIPIFPVDANPRVAKLLVDHRAIHYWDGEGKLGLAVSKLGLAARQLGYGGTEAWDIFLVYRPDAKWGELPAAVGSPVVSERGALERALRPYL